MSALNDILVALKNNIQSKVGARATVVKRKRAIVLPGEKLPMIVVCPNGGETLEEETFAQTGDTVWEYPILVSILSKGDRVQELELTEDLELRQDVRNEIYKAPLVGASTTWDVRVETHEPFAQISVQGVYDVTGFSLYVKSEETRG